ncbi:MAG: heavy metal-responsive transcriptional regulator [Pyrinomonas sp.]|uniref:MerR family transcriptional regulator n=1 Tax=Pyrinomonas sp. TaxID=2080306 RepID=UPI003317EC21
MKRRFPASELLIGEVAARAGVSVDTIRYYERRRLLPPAARTTGGFRLFKSDVIARVRFIKQAQSIGFSLEEIAALFSSKDSISECQKMRDLLQVKIKELDERIAELRRMRRLLHRYLDECERELRRHGKVAECPVVDEISHTKEGKG